jgi:hypothetical protein
MLSRILVVAALAVPMFADNDDWRRGRNDGYYGRDDDYRRNRRDDDHRRNRNRDYGYSRNDRYGYGNGTYGSGTYGYGNGGIYSRGNSGVIYQTLRDLQSAASRNRVDGHERDHFNRAMSELQQISYRSQGQMDAGRLNRVLEDLDHLSRADQIHPRDRQVLARDRQALQSTYYNGGGYNGW